jgi:glycosyltransferase involved in cell wall biosynthesis
MKVSIIIPCYNENSTICTIIDKVKKFNKFEKEIIVVDDFSDDGTVILLKKFKDEKEVKIFLHDKNYGKGKAIRTALNYVTGDYVIIQDADLEYDPADYDLILKPFLQADADVVYGSRFLGGNGYVRLHFFWHYVANKILTLLSNVITNLNMTDMETGSKAFKTSAIKSIKLFENGFGIEPEMTIKLAKKNFKFFEVSVSYKGRSYEEGKKIRLKDAFRAVYCLIKYSFS